MAQGTAKVTDCSSRRNDSFFKTAWVPNIPRPVERYTHCPTQAQYICDKSSGQCPAWGDMPIRGRSQLTCASWLGANSSMLLGNILASSLPCKNGYPHSASSLQPHWTLDRSAALTCTHVRRLAPEAHHTPWLSCTTHRTGNRHSIDAP